MHDDFVLPFQIEGQPFRGRLVRLGAALNGILTRHAYEESVSRLLGETVALATAMGSSFKFDGVFTLQARGEGAISLLVADVTSAGAIRGYAQRKANVEIKEGTSLLGKGYVAFTADQSANDERYQGVVEREGDDLSKAVQNYFRQSEQVPTALIAAASQDASGAWRGGCILLQRVALDGGIKPVLDTAEGDDWHRAMVFLQTCTKEELTDPNLRSEDLLYRLFNEDGVRVFEPLPLRHECRCSADKVRNVLITLPESEVQHLLQDGKISATCEFCNETYSFTEEEVKALRPTASPEA